MGQGAFRRALQSDGRTRRAPSVNPGAARARERLRPTSAVDRYRALFDFAPDGYLATDARGRIEEANRVAGSLLHVRPSDLPGRPLSGFISPADRKKFHARLKALRRSGRPGIEELAIRFQPAVGPAFDAALTGARVRTYRRLALAWSLRDIHKRTRVERKLRESEQRYLSLYQQMLESRNELRFLAARSANAREEEARRIARELHDEARQTTVSIHFVLAEIDAWLPDAAKQRLDSVRKLLDELEERLRTLSHELRPTILDDLGLGPALEFLAKGFAARTGIPLSLGEPPGRRFEPVVETAVYRIVQEALTNIARHARASHAAIRLSLQRRILRCAIRDDGIGLRGDPLCTGSSQRRGLGLLGIRERLDGLGGKLRLRSKSGVGTELLVTIPIRSRA